MSRDRLRLAAFGMLTAVSVVALLMFRSQPADSTAFVPGVPDDHMIVAAAIQSQYPQSFQDVSGLTDEQSEANRTKNVRLWEGGLTLDPGPQQIGDCVSWGLAHAIETRLWVAQHRLPNPRGPPRPVSTLYAYGVTRVTVGRHKPPCGQDGAFPSFAVQGFEQYGFLYTDEAGLPPYNGKAAKQFGCNGPTTAQIQAGRKRTGGACQPLPTAIALRNAICSGGYPATSAFDWTPGKAYVADGRRCLKFNGKKLGGHQTCIIGYDGSTSAGPWFYLMNSHGANWPSNAPPMQGEPPGGVWVHQTEMNRLVDQGEFWAISDVPNFEAEDLDLSIFNLN